MFQHTTASLLTPEIATNISLTGGPDSFLLQLGKALPKTFSFKSLVGKSFKGT